MTLKELYNKNITISFYEEDDWFVAHLLEFDLLDTGESYEEAEKNLKELFLFDIEACYEHNLLKNVVQDASENTPKNNTKTISIKDWIGEKFLYIETNFKNKEKLKKIAQNLTTQDNRITADPIFYVQENQRIWGFDPHYSENYVWIDDEGNDIGEEFYDDLDFLEENDYCDEEDVIKCRERLRQYGVNEENCQKVYYIDIWENVQPFFTEEEAQQYLKINGHNLKNPRIYVACAFRNEEWQLMREYIIQNYA